MRTRTRRTKERKKEEENEDENTGKDKDEHDHKSFSSSPIVHSPRKSLGHAQRLLRGLDEPKEGRKNLELTSHCS